MILLTPYLLHFISSGLAIILSSFGTALGESIAGEGTIHALNRQELGRTQAFRALIIGLALVESGGILSLVIALMLLFARTHDISWSIACGELGIGIALGFSALSVGIASGYAVKSAITAIMRQPFFAQKIVTFMLITQSMIEAPVIFSFIVGLIIKGSFTADMPLPHGIKLCVAGILIGLGSIGPSIGQAFFCNVSCYAIGMNRKAYKNLFAFSLLNQALIETPVIFSLLLSILIIFKPGMIETASIEIASYIGAALAMGLASLGVGISTGYVASRSCYQMAHSPGDYSLLFRSSLLAQVFIESCAIYALIIGLVLVMRC
jgi:F-type H+-transporting ATPase subunit c